MSTSRLRKGLTMWCIAGFTGALLAACGLPPDAPTDQAMGEAEASAAEPMSRTTALSYPVGSPGGSWIRTCDPRTTYLFSKNGVAWFCALCLDKTGHIPSYQGEPAAYCIHADNCPRWCAWNNDGRLTCGNC